MKKDEEEEEKMKEFYYPSLYPFIATPIILPHP